MSSFSATVCVRPPALFKANNPVAVQLLTRHNLVYIMSMGKNMRQAILDDKFAELRVDFVREQFLGLRLEDTYPPLPPNPKNKHEAPGCSRARLFFEL
jgi:queuine/archaeosine tRNA-ribosyltransferase